MMINITEARQYLKQAMETQGRNFIYNPHPGRACYYTAEDAIKVLGTEPDALGKPKVKTGCLIGVALDIAGETRHHGGQGPVPALAKQYPDMMSPIVVQYYAAAQSPQDNGESWGIAYDKAERWYKNELSYGAKITETGI
jgi:hypothetical protein